MKNPFAHILFFLLLALGWTEKLYAQDTSLAPGRQSPPDSVYINNIFIIGNEKTQKNIILRELDFTSGHYYNWDTFLEIIQADQNKIYNLRLFTSVEITPLFTEDDQVEILIRVKERWYIIPSIIFELADRNFSEWWTNQNRDLSRVNFGLRVSHGNVGGRNEKLRFSGQLGFTRALDLRYSKPYIDKNQKHGLATQITFFEQKTLAIRSADNRQVFFTNETEDILRKSLTAAVQYTYRRTFYNFHFLTLGYSSNTVDEDVLTENPNYFLHGDNSLRYLYMSYTFRHDNRDLAAYATKGELLQATATKYGIFNTDDIDEIEVSITANKYLPINDKLHFATGLTANWFLSPNQPYTLVRGVGYNPNFIRGYELNVIEGQQLYVHKNSFRWKFLDWAIDISNVMPLEQFSTIPFRFYLSANFDHGYVKDRNRLPENAQLTNQYLYGYGLGIDMVGFYDAVFRLEYSLNNSGQGNLFLNFKAPF
ncbi:MAG: OMA87 family outer membrane receptor [Algoriphagus marincola HL-49]|uniref:OMA87 family outer membrane receptor n=1 Tax=Algoriphagus marincola HL-49 TaxID=1305737 RepID=A0A0N8KGU2_9BACT|nr:MAG: OMA87 family outer membrane receptor [Algoriphagus marincola HL-49]